MTTRFMTGLCSEFGGRDDKTMASDSGLACYEPWEADNRVDLFEPWKVHGEPTWKRLKTESFYLAFRFKDTEGPWQQWSRIQLQSIPWKIMAPSGKYVLAFLVDNGPGITSRIVDLSPGALSVLGVQTDELVSVCPISLT